MDNWEEWQKVYRHGTLVIWPPDDVRKVVNQQRMKYDPKSASICETHITLSQPLLKPLSNKEWIRIQEISTEFDPFEIQYGPLKSFLPYPCIWYDVQPANRILAIRESLHQSSFFNLSLRHTEGFIPHMTITEGLSGPAVTDELLSELQSQSVSGSFICKEITFIKPDETFTFHVKKLLPLGH
jgi:2'-5' RNA ligase